MTLIKWRFVAKRTSYMRYFDTRTYFVARTNDYREINDRLVCEQVSWLGFGVCFGGGATSASWQEELGVGGGGVGERSEPACTRAIFFLF